MGFFLNRIISELLHQLKSGLLKAKGFSKADIDFFTERGNISDENLQILACKELLNRGYTLIYA